MKPELTLLTCAVVLTLVQAVIAVTGAMLQVGLPALAGNREGMAEITGWGGRGRLTGSALLRGGAPGAGKGAGALFQCGPTRFPLAWMPFRTASSSSEARSVAVPTSPTTIPAP